MYIDIIFMLIIIISIIFGIKKGFIFEFFSIFGIVISAMFAKKFSVNVHEALFKDGDKFSYIIAYVLTFLAIYFVIFIILFLLKKFFEAIMLGWVDRICGGIAGLVKGVLICFVILVILSVVSNFNKGLDKYLKGSYSGRVITYITPGVFKIFPAKIEEMVNRYVNKNYVNGKNIDELLDKITKENKDMTKDQSETLNKIINKKNKDEIDEEFLNNLLKDMKDDDSKDNADQNKSKKKSEKKKKSKESTDKGEAE